MKIEIRPPETAEEVKAACQLIYKTFGPNYHAAERRIKSLYKRELQTTKNIMVLKQQNKIVGTLFISDLTLNLRGNSVRAGGITNVCIDPACRGKGFGRALMLESIKRMREYGYTVSLLFARRAVDDFYTEYGYLGTGHFCELRMDVAGAPFANGHADDITFDPGPHSKHKTQYDKMYRDIYRGIPFSFERASGWWKDIEQRLRIRLRVNAFRNIFVKDKLVGYFIIDGDRVIEAACFNKSRDVFIRALTHYCRARRIPTLILSLPGDHPCIRFFQRRNHTIQTRRAWNGGHMLKVLDLVRFGSILKGSVNADRHEFGADVVASANCLIEDTIASIRVHPDSPRESDSLKSLITNDRNPALRQLGDKFCHTWSVMDEF